MSVLPLPKASPCQTQMEIAFAGETLVLDACGALYFPERDLLAVADLHLEKGSFFASRGIPIPCYDTRDTLLRLTEAIRCYRPRTVVSLGDSFHDGRAGERMTAADAELLQTLVSSVAEWIWLTGNHDPTAPARFAGSAASHFNAGPMTLCHRPEEGAAPRISGHYHPKHLLRLSSRQHIAARCFILGPELLLMPAFGAYAGGLNTGADAFTALFDTQSRRHILLYRDKLWAID